jgi:hypothetical protein
MNQTVSIQQAISAQIARVDAIRRAVQPLPGKLHHTIGNKAARQEHVLENSRKYLDRHAATGKPLVSPPVINNAMRLLQSVVALKKHRPDVLPGDMFFSDGISIGITRDPISVDSNTLAVTFPYAVSQVLGEAQILSHDLTYISGDIVDLLATASATLDNEALQLEDLIAPSGFCYLEKPLIVGDYHPETGEFRNDINIGWRGFAWDFGTEEDGTLGVSFLIYTDYGCFRHIYLPSLHAATGEDTTDHYVGSSVFRDEDLLACDMMRWGLGTPWENVGGINAEEIIDRLANNADGKPKPVNPHIAFFRKFFLTMMRFCWQELLISEPATIPRPLRRAAVRELATDMTMNVLRLRRVKHSSGAGTGDGVRLDHRIVVRGHWRNQHYPTFGPAYSADGSYNASSHRRIWIDPHIKGPEDAPFINKHKVNALVR